MTFPENCIELFEALKKCIVCLLEYVQYVQLKMKLDKVGPVDNKPSINFGRRQIIINKWHLTYDTFHVTHVTWHVWCDTWHLTHGGDDHSLKIQLPSSYSLGDKVFWRYFHTGSLNEWVTKVFIEQPQLHFFFCI